MYATLYSRNKISTPRVALWGKNSSYISISEDMRKMSNIVENLIRRYVENKVLTFGEFINGFSNFFITFNIIMTIHFKWK